MREMTRRGTMAALAAATILGLAGVASAENGKNLLWVQPMRDHPVHRLMQQGFLDKCKELGYTCEIVGNPSATNWDVAGTLPLDATSVLAVSGLRQSGADWQLIWPSAAGRVYRILQGESPAGPFDQVLATEAASPPQNTFDLNAPLPNPVFFRVEIAP